MSIISKQIYLEPGSIKNKMRRTIEEHLHKGELQEHLTMFLEEKDQFPFANMASCHYQAFGGQDESSIQTLSAGIELLILSFDIFDDLEDEDNFDAPWMKLSPPIALNAATSIYTIGIHTICAAGSNVHLLSAASRYALQSMQGQHLDLKNEMATEDECLEMMKLKAGSLFALSCILGTLLANGKAYPCIEAYAYQLGIAAQIENDYKGLFQEHNNDIKQQKRSLAYLYLSREFTTHSSEILSMIDHGRFFQQEFKDIIEYKEKLHVAGVTQYMNVMKNLAIHHAKKEMEKLTLPKDQLMTIQSVMFDKF
ncbi:MULTISPECIES: polyprenyl synthetase family protein [Bacillus]|nr:MULTISPECIES: polyprenyl synthetase family protein [Bacillus]MBP1081048.1 competence protein ComQ [Bacillus capparidis]MED1095740.1 polyprenyl synthetase family protein [Bacillus capparidis]